MPLRVENARRQLRELMKEKKIDARRAFKRLSLKYHPNKGGSVENQQTLQKALNTIDQSNSRPRTRSQPRRQEQPRRSRPTYQPGNYGWVKVDSEYVRGRDGRLRQTCRITNRVKSTTGRHRIVSRRCEGLECFLAALMNTYSQHFKKKTDDYYKPTSCTMQKVPGATTKTGRKCVPGGRTSEQQIEARRKYDKKFIPWYRAGAKGQNPAYKK